MAIQPQDEGDAAEEPFLERAIGAVVSRHDPARRTLKDEYLLGNAREVRHELDGAGAGANHRDTASCRVQVVVPARRMERRPREVLQTREGGNVGPIELAGAA